MNWDKDKSVTLSMACVVAFAVILAALDLAAWTLVGLVTSAGVFTNDSPYARAALLTVVYAGSVLAWICLWKLWRLLRNVKGGVVFADENVALLRAVSWCCVGAMVVCLTGGAFYYPFFVLSAAAGFMALIVRVVKNVFQQAIAMQDELDFTI